MTEERLDCYIQRMLNSGFSRLEKAHRHRYSFWILIVAAITLSFLSAFPSYDVAYSQEMDENWSAIVEQVRAPLNPVEYDGSSHQANLAFRLTPVLIAGVFGVDTINGFLLLQFVCFVLLFWVVARLLKKVNGDPVVYYLLTLSISFTFVGNVLCSDYRGFFDVVAYLFLSASLLLRNPFAIFMALLFAYFTDERALIASGLVFLFFILEDKSSTENITVKQFFYFSTKLITVVLSWICYFSIRWLLGYFFGLKTNSEVLVDYLITQTIHQINLLPFGVWTGLEGFWVFIVLSFVVLIQRRWWAFIGFYSLALMVVIFISIWVFDITRSMAYLLPSIFVSLRLLSTNENRVLLRYASVVILLLCIFPTYYAGGSAEINWLLPLPLQILRLLFNA